MAAWSPMDLLPGLWAGFLALVLRAALRRWYDPVPDRVLLAFGAALVLLFGPVLFGGQLLLPLDNLRGHAPFQELPPTDPHGNIVQGDLIQLTGPSQVAVRAALDLRRWPLWNPSVGAGMPLLADPQAQAFQPLQLLAFALPWVRAAGAVAALRVLTALVFTFLWMRRQGIGAGPATAGAFAYGLGGFVILWVGWPIANAAALLPLGLYAAALCHQRGERRDLLLLALGGFSLFLGGHPETVLYAFGLLLVVLVAQALDGSGGEMASLRFRRLRASLLALGIAGLVAAPVLLPTFEYLPKTLRASRLTHTPRPLAGEGPGVRASLLPIAAPNAYGNSRFIYYWGPNNTNEDAAGFVGTATLLAVLLGIGARRRFPRELLFLGVAILVLAVLAVPGVSRRPLLLLALALAYLGACTLERFRRGEVRWWPVLLAGAALAAVIVWGYLAHPDPQDPERLAILRFGWLRWQMRFLVASSILLVLARGRRWMPPAVAGLIAAELLLAHRPANPPMPQRLAFPEVPAVAFLQKNLEDGRMAALGRAFPPNLPSLWGLADARVYNPMAPRAYVDFTAPVTAAWWGELPEWGRPRNPLYGRLGVRYILTGPEETLRPPLRLAFSDATARIWEVPEPRPVRSLAGRRLETSIFQDGHWSVFADGVRMPPEPADGPFVAARLPAGARKVDLVYRPGSFVLGCVLAALGLAVGATALIAVPPPARR
ncbi:MAG TPA: hypothetical protein VKM72_25810 [Thermoanaerobaculia bacterium]|nr:hypothetical protein [Thermoanaerobaculia bacterium]